MRQVIIVLTMLLAIACATEAEPGPLFDNESARELTCMKHQQDPPGTRYTDTTQRRTDETLALLRYYTANGAKPYCDGKGPTETDQQWAGIYVHLGADRKHVAELLG
jgi:hypothetical protein